MTDRFPDHLATLVIDVRREVTPAWDTPGVMTAVRNAIGLGEPRAATACAAIRAAANPSNRTPAVIAMPGDHWQRGDAPRDTPLPPRFLPGIDDRQVRDPDVARRGAAACRHQLGDTAADAAKLDRKLARVLRDVRELAPNLSAAQRDRLARACCATDTEEAS